MWDFDSDRDDEIDYSDSFVRFRNFYEYISNPRWYTDLLNEFWKEKLHGYFILDEHGAGHHCSDYGNLYYLNKHIDLEKYDFSGKRIILFATSGGSRFGKAFDNLKVSTPNAVIIEGKVNPSAAEIQALAEM